MMSPMPKWWPAGSTSHCVGPRRANLRSLPPAAGFMRGPLSMPPPPPRGGLGRLSPAGPPLLLHTNNSHDNNAPPVR